MSADSIVTSRMKASDFFALPTSLSRFAGYFRPEVPPWEWLKQISLTLAARRNVAVDLVLPVKSNHRMADLARHRALRELAGAGARIWLVHRMIHAKAIVVDDAIALAGSANLDARSLFLNFEVMVAFYGQGDVRGFGAWIDRQASGAKRYVPRAPSLPRDLAEGLVLWLAFQL